MSRVPMGSDGGNFSSKLTDRYMIIPQGFSAEMIASQWGFTREELDRFSYESHQKALRAQREGRFDREIVPIEVVTEEGETVRMEKDETPRADTSLEKMAQLQPSFQADGVVTAGNSSQISDGAAAVLVASREKARSWGLSPGRGSSPPPPPAWIRRSC